MSGLKVSPPTGDLNTAYEFLKPLFDLSNVSDTLNCMSRSNRYSLILGSQKPLLILGHCFQYIFDITKSKPVMDCNLF